MSWIEILFWVIGAILIGVSAIWVLAFIAVFIGGMQVPDDFNDEE